MSFYEEGHQGGTFEDGIELALRRLLTSPQFLVRAEKEPANLPWKDLGVEIVIESTGLFVDPAKARAHIEAGSGFRLA